MTLTFSWCSRCMLEHTESLSHDPDIVIVIAGTMRYICQGKPFKRFVNFSLAATSCSLYIDWLQLGCGNNVWRTRRFATHIGQYAKVSLLIAIKLALRCMQKYWDINCTYSYCSTLFYQHYSRTQPQNILVIRCFKQYGFGYIFVNFIGYPKHGSLWYVFKKIDRIAKILRLSFFLTDFRGFY